MATNLHHLGISAPLATICVAKVINQKEQKRELRLVHHIDLISNQSIQFFNYLNEFFETKKPPTAKDVGSIQ